MIKLYWPAKAIPEWLFKLEFENPPGPMKVHHDGYGVIWKHRGKFYVLHLLGHCVRFEHCWRTSVTLNGQEKGVCIMSIGGLLARAKEKLS